MILLLLADIVIGTINAQDRQQGNQLPYQIPQTVYVGDRAMLVLPLPEHTISSDITVNLPLLDSDEIELHRITLEQFSNLV